MGFSRKARFGVTREVYVPIEARIGIRLISNRELVTPQILEEDRLRGLARAYLKESV